MQLNLHNTEQEPVGKAAAITRGFGTAAVLIGLWWLAVLVFQPAHFILPGPDRVLAALWQQAPSLLNHAGITFTEIILGLMLGIVFGVSTAIAMNASSLAKRYVMPVIVASQALPVFAIAPLLVLWFGLGLGSKVAMATLIIYFPVASALNDGLARADRNFIDIARMYGATPWQTLKMFRMPAALPSLASGIRVAATVAPIGAVVGEWVGASGGLGYIINQANARMQTDTVFAGLILLILMVVLLRLAIDTLLDKLIFWSPRTNISYA